MKLTKILCPIITLTAIATTFNAYATNTDPCSQDPDKTNAICFENHDGSTQAIYVQMTITCSGAKVLADKFICNGKPHAYSPIKGNSNEVSVGIPFNDPDDPNIQVSQASINMQFGSCQMILNDVNQIKALQEASTTFVCGADGKFTPLSSK